MAPKGAAANAHRMTIRELKLVRRGDGFVLEPDWSFVTDEPVDFTVEQVDKAVSEVRRRVKVGSHATVKINQYQK